MADEVELRHGVFLGPWHALNENPTLCYQRDLELMEWLDELGFAEAWIGEHHSAGWELIASPELFIAAAAERTRRLRFGTGVVSLPYHHPFMVAERITQLDHMTMGRVMFGAGPGLLASDALMLGIDPSTQRDRMVEALEVILRLLDGETVTTQTDWFVLQEARLQLLPYTQPRPEVAVASTITPSGAVTAGRLGLGLLCLAASDAAGIEVLASNWRRAIETAGEHGHVMGRERLRLVVPMHMAETRAKARENVRFGLQGYIDYTNTNSIRFKIPEGTDPVDHMIDSGYAVIGTPDDAIEMIDRLLSKQGDFGCLLTMAVNWADWAETKRSYELYARYVIPHFSAGTGARRRSFESVDAHGASLRAMRQAATDQAIAKHASPTPAATNEASPP